MLGALPVFGNVPGKGSGIKARVVKGPEKGPNVKGSSVCMSWEKVVGSDFVRV